jgi:hypothetical protein
MRDRLVALLEAQLDLQRKLGADPTTMDQEMRCAYFRDYVLGTIDELHEALQGVGWKPWATSRHLKEDEVFGELRDAWQILTNLMFIAKQVTPEELADLFEDALYAKLKVNHRRVEEGYDGVTGKCAACRRAFDDEAVTCTPADINEDTNLAWCQVYGSQLDWEKTA